MERQEQIRSMRSSVGDYPNTSQIAKYLGKSRDSVRNLVSGLEYVQNGRSKQYFVNDVVDRIRTQRAV